MNSDWGYYEKYLKAMQTTGGSSSSRDQATDNFEESMSDDPGYQPGATVNGENVPILANPKDSIMCEFRAAPGADIHIGDIIHVYDEDWLVVELYIDKVGIVNGEMWVCNETLKFQNHSPDILTHKCVVDDGRFTKRSIDPLVYIPINTYLIYMSINPDTIKLHVDKRLSLGTVWDAENEQVLAVYKIIGIDIKSKNHATGDHLMMMTVQKDVYHDEKDDMATGICDVFKPQESEETPAETGSCSIGGKDKIRIGTARKYTAEFKNADGTTAEDATATWTVSAPSGVIYATNGNVCTVTVPLDEGLVGKTVKITLADKDGKYGTEEKTVGVITVG